MSAQVLGLVLDIAVLIFLGAMIFYAVRLSENLKEFRAQRGAFDGVIADLLAAIDQAERSIQNLKQASTAESAEMDDLLRKAKLYAQELRDVNQASESMAKRLEALAEKNRKIMQGVSDMPSPVASPASSGDFASPPAQEKKPQPYMPKSVSPQRVKQDAALSKADLPSFMIQDRDFEDLDALGERLETQASNRSGAESEEDMPAHLQSQAEKELYDALMGAKQNPYRRRS